ncbi:hypothetical protein QWJ20_00100 [Pectobacterium sp. S5]|uniref:hypothetical protein n=1 Tax=Pectobacterium TaxID=122277 RepID=UPI003D9ACE00
MDELVTKLAKDQRSILSDNGDYLSDAQMFRSLVCFLKIVAREHPYFLGCF